MGADEHDFFLERKAFAFNTKHDFVAQIGDNYSQDNCEISHNNYSLLDPVI